MTLATIGYVHGGTVRAEFAESLLAEARTSPMAGEVVAVSSGPNIARARNLLCRIFLTEHTTPWLWMLDTDMMFPAGTLARLTAAADPDRSPIVGALCVTANDDQPPRPTMYQLADHDGRPRWRVMTGYSDDALVYVGATGAACLLIHRGALEKIAAESGDPAWPWFAESAMGATTVGEDITFCMRARQAGLPVKVHTGIHAGHIKPAVMWPGQPAQQLGR